MSSDFSPEFQITKLDAACRQLDTAIQLLFEQGDSVSIHTLAHAAFGILKGVATHRRETQILDTAHALAAEGKSGDFWTGFNRAGNFFKHADKDPNGVFVGIQEENEALISIAVRIYLDLGCSITPQMTAFSLWWACINFRPIDNVKEPFRSWLNENHHRLYSDTRPDLLVLGYELLTLSSNDPQ